nr:hypothetical protein [Kiritimatiella glycovorans]
MALLLVGGDGASAMVTLDQAPERVAGAPRVASASPVLANLLHAVKHLPRDKRRVFAFVHLAAKPEDADIERIGENRVYATHRERLAPDAHKPPVLNHGGDLRNRVLPGCVGLKHPTEKRRSLFVENDHARSPVVHVAGRRHVRIDAFPELLPYAALDVLRKVVHVVFALPECHLQDKLALRGVLKPERRELQGGQFTGVQVVDDSSSVNGIPGQPVGVPSKDCLGVAVFNRLHHLVEDRASRFLGRLRFEVLVRHVEPILACQHAEFVELCVNRKHLPAVVLGGLPGVDEELHGFASFRLAFASSATFVASLAIFRNADTSGVGIGLSRMCSPSVNSASLLPARRPSIFRTFSGMTNCPFDESLAI